MGLRSVIEPRTTREAVRFVVVYTAIALVVSVAFCLISLYTIGAGADAFLRAAIVVPLVLAPPMSWLGARTMLRFEDMRRELARIVTLDPLSGALNRRGLQEFAEAAFKSRDDIGEMSAIILDVDCFKSINDTYGHGGGDAVISQLVRVIEGAIETDHAVVGRLGGDELVVYFVGAPLEETLQRAEAIRNAIETAVVRYESERIPVTASFGVAVAMREDTDTNPMLRRADRALYAAKDAGRNRVRAAA